jgi:hypothetical protein
MSIEMISLIVTVIIALLGYLVTYWTNILLANRSQQLELVNKQIQEFYGPLYVATQNSAKAYEALMRKLNRKIFFTDKSNPPNEQEIAEWRLWAQSVFMPNNKLIEKLILEKAYLIRERDMPECLLNFITHVSGLKVVVEKWSKGDFSEHTSVVFFPKEIDHYATESYKELKDKQLELIGRLRK